MKGLLKPVPWPLTVLVCFFVCFFSFQQCQETYSFNVCPHSTALFNITLINFNCLSFIALHNNTYRLVGQMLAVCLIHGGVSPHFFSKRLFNQVCGLPPSPATIEEVVDHSLRAKLEKASLEVITHFTHLSLANKCSSIW